MCVACALRVRCVCVAALECSKEPCSAEQVLLSNPKGLGIKNQGLGIWDQGLRI